MKIRRCLLVAFFAALSCARLAAIELRAATIAELQSEMAKGSLTAEKLTQLYLARVAAYTAGPMARSVYDVAIALGAMTGLDSADPATLGDGHAFEQATHAIRLPKHTPLLRGDVTTAAQ